MEVVKLKPYLTYKIWGGDKLSSLKGLNEPFKSEQPLGETWEISIHPSGESTTIDGKLLSSVIDRERLPYLVKFIDTSQNLSVQVHPDQEYAQKFENDNGKNECWLILDAKEGSGIYLGFKKGVSKEDFKRSIDNKENVNELLNFYPVKRGDFFFVPAGSVHAIGDGITLCEVQRSSGVTYRIWDWNRLENGKPRELHLEKSFDVLNFNEEENTKEFFQYRSNIFSNKSIELASDDLFEATSFHLDHGDSIKIDHKKRLASVVVLSGVLEIDKSTISAYECCVIDTEKNEEALLVAKENCEFVIVQ